MPAPTVAVNSVTTKRPAIPQTTPYHPFAVARDANYAPPRNRNVGAPYTKSKDKEYPPQTTALVQNPKIADDIFSRTMKTPFLIISSEELYSLSPKIRAKVCDSVTPHQNPQPTAAMASIVELDGNVDIHKSVNLAALPFTNASIEKVDDDYDDDREMLQPSRNYSFAPNTATAGPSTINTVAVLQ